jgi:hypothetical protein
MARHDMDLVFAGVEVIKQTLGVQRAGRSGDGNK